MFDKGKQKFSKEIYTIDIEKMQNIGEWNQQKIKAGGLTQGKHNS